MHKVHFTLLLFIIVSSILWSQESYFYFDHLTTEDGLSREHVRRIVQDKKGFMWFGTANGLNKYDGYSFKVYTNDSTSSPYLTNNFILSLIEDQYGRLWIGTMHGLNVFDLKTNKIFHFRHSPDNDKSLAGDWIRCIYEDSRGNIWIGTKNNGLSYLDHSYLNADTLDNNLSFINYVHNSEDTTSLAMNYINSICEDSSGYIWIGTMSAGLNRFDPARKTFKRLNYLKYKGIFFRVIQKIWREPDTKNNILWIATNNTFNEFDVTHNIVKTYPYKNYIGHGFVTIAKMNDHTLWLGSERDGIYIFDKNKGITTRINGQHYNPGSIRNTWINDLYKDNCGRMWVATYGGIYKYDRVGHKFPLYQIEVDFSEGKRICNIFHIIEDSNPESPIIWIATPENGIVRFNRETGNVDLLSGIDINIRYNYLLQDPDQPEFFWIATWGTPLVKKNMENGEEEQYEFTSDFSKNNPNANIKLFTNRFSRQVIKDSKGNIWQASTSGLFKINPKTKQYILYRSDYKNQEGFIGNNVTTILEEKSGMFWAGTTENGLNRFDPETERFTNYRHEPQNERSLIGNYINTLFEDKSGTLWVGSGKMLHRFNREQNCLDRYQELQGAIKGILEDVLSLVYTLNEYPSYLFKPFAVPNHINPFLSCTIRRTCSRDKPSSVVR